MENSPEQGSLFEIFNDYEYANLLNGFATPRPEQFFDAAYTPILQQQISILIKEEAPIEIGRLARLICKAHGWKRTGTKIKHRIDVCLGEHKVYQEGNATFVWPSDAFQDTVPYRNIEGRSTADISRHELLGLIENHPELAKSKDAIHDFADLLGIKRLTQSTKVYLEEVLALAFKSKVK